METAKVEIRLRDDEIEYIKLDHEKEVASLKLQVAEGESKLEMAIKEAEDNKAALLR